MRQLQRLPRHPMLPIFPPLLGFLKYSFGSLSNTNEANKGGKRPMSMPQHYIVSSNPQINQDAGGRRGGGGGGGGDTGDPGHDYISLLILHKCI